MMKKILLGVFIAVLSINGLYSAEFINPNGFKGSEAEKQQVLAYIKENVKATSETLGMGDPSTLRIMETEELKSFKSLVGAENKDLLDSVVKQACGIGMCLYSAIDIMYSQQLEDSKKELQW